MIDFFRYAADYSRDKLGFYGHGATDEAPEELAGQFQRAKSRAGQKQTRLYKAIRFYVMNQGNTMRCTAYGVAWGLSAYLTGLLKRPITIDPVELWFLQIEGRGDPARFERNGDFIYAALHAIAEHGIHTETGEFITMDMPKRLSRTWAAIVGHFSQSNIPLMTGAPVKRPIHDRNYFYRPATRYDGYGHQITLNGIDLEGRDSKGRPHIKAVTQYGRYGYKWRGEYFIAEEHVPYLWTIYKPENIQVFDKKGGIRIA